MHDLHIQRVCGVNETVTTFFFALLQVKPILLKTYRYLCIIKNRKAAVSKMYEPFWTTLCLAIYICMSGKFPIFLSPPVQFMSIVLQHSMEQFVSLLLSHDLDKNQQMCKILFLLFWNASWLSFTSHSMKLQLVDISGWVNNPNYNLGFIKTQNRTSNYHFTKILHRNTL